MFHFIWWAAGISNFEGWPRPGVIISVMLKSISSDVCSEELMQKKTHKIDEKLAAVARMRPTNQLKFFTTSDSTSFAFC